MKYKLPAAAQGGEKPARRGSQTEAAAKNTRQDFILSTFMLTPNTEGEMTETGAAKPSSETRGSIGLPFSSTY